MTIPEKMLNIKEFARLSNYSERLIRRYCGEGKIEGAFKLSDKSRKWLIPSSSLQKLEPRINETANRKPELPPRTNADVSRVYDRPSEILSKLVKGLHDIKDISKNMTSSLSSGESKEDYSELLRREIKLARDEFVSGRVFLPIDFVKVVDIFFLKIAEMDIEFGSAMDANTPNGPERAQYWKKAETIAHQEIPNLLDTIENQARMIITEKVNTETLRPSIEVTPKKDGDVYHLEVKNNGNVADFEAQIEIIKDATGYDRGKLYIGYWEFGQSSKATIGNIDRIKIAQLDTRVPPKGAQPIAAFFMRLQLYYAEKSSVGPPNFWNSTSWTITKNDAIIKPEYILKVIITSNPPLREGKFIREYKLDFEGLSEITLP